LCSALLTRADASLASEAELDAGCDARIASLAVRRRVKAHSCDVDVVPSRAVVLLALVSSVLASGCDGCVKSVLSSDDGTCERLAATLHAADAHIVMCGPPSTGNAGSTSGQWSEFLVVYGDARDFNSLDASIVGSLAEPPYAPLSRDGGPPRQWVCKSTGRRWKELFLVERQADPRNDATASAVCAAYAKL
jgi:hypothetical protein